MGIKMASFSPNYKGGGVTNSQIGSIKDWDEDDRILPQNEGKDEEELKGKSRICKL
jgi:hypothetical protein